MPLNRPNLVRTALAGTAALVIAAALLLPALNRESAGPDSGRGIATPGTWPRTVPSTQTARIPGELRVASFNVRRCVGLDGYRDARRIARQLSRDPGPFDLVGLNEVAGNDPDFPNQAAAIAQRADPAMGWLYAPSERIAGRDNIGNAVLTALPVDHYQRVPMRKTLPDGHRSYVLLTLNVDGRRVHAIVTHLDGSEDRDAQLSLVIDLFESLQPPVLLMGDFNTTADHPLIRELLARENVVEALATPDRPERSPATRPARPARPDRIDWIFARGADVLDAGWQDVGTSDHPLIWARLKLR